MTLAAPVLVGAAVAATTGADITGTVTCGISYVAAAESGGSASCGEGKRDDASGDRPEPGSNDPKEGGTDGGTAPRAALASPRPAR